MDILTEIRKYRKENDCLLLEAYIAIHKAQVVNAILMMNKEEFQNINSRLRNIVGINR